MTKEQKVICAKVGVLDSCPFRRLFMSGVIRKADQVIHLRSRMRENYTPEP
jgi:hypothetical protein